MFYILYTLRLELRAFYMPCVARCVFFAGIGTMYFNATDYTGVKHILTSSTICSLWRVACGKQNKLANAIQCLACKTPVKSSSSPTWTKRL